MAFTFKKIDHVGVCVADIDQAAENYLSALGLVAVDRELVASQKTDVCFLRFPDGGGDASVELISPQGNDGLEKFLTKRGAGLHHVAFEVEDIVQALAELKEKGVALIDETPRIGARGHKVAFIHPKAMGGVLVELVQH
ncbi:methylmalonyl-CoA epimerase [Pendulispora brunnea]|uniref:Methylmalonyl-CoA epimerase n=1 Tax=Pendulispora brunnea TaxID=2905690 RepID=A0ABZ2KF63_9BACT